MSEKRKYVGDVMRDKLEMFRKKNVNNIIT